MVRHLLTLRDYDGKWITEVIDKAILMKKDITKYYSAMANKTLLMLFMKTSTRTRCSFEAGMTQLGGHAIFLDWRASNFTLGDAKDEVRCLDRYADVIMARVYKHEQVAVLAKHSKVPVINALCDMYHPCQTLADLMTIKEKKGELKGLKLTYIGDGNNVCNSLIAGCTRVGMKVAVATPKGFEPHPDVVAEAKKTGLLELYNKPEDALPGSDVVYTDTWISMGQEEEKEKKLKAFAGYTVSLDLLKRGKAENALIMHCLPAHRGYEISD
ncbi:ornithine carbamoyltransferase, partial [Candidatus Woesearchaeota archaeon CG08_land_8_20_14_0_20_43_7]